MNALSQEELLTHVISERGYAVIACNYPRDIRERVSNIRAPTNDEIIEQPWVVTKETDLQDFKEQLEIYARLGQPCLDPSVNSRFFYRVTTD